jgi:hypothetical protein
MSGYRYSFTGLSGYDLPVVKMLGSNYGSYQMLNIGMKVKVEYRLSKKSRVVTRIEQIPYGARLGIPDV